MSLINEALKKADRLRNEAPVDATTAPLASGGRTEQHRRHQNSNSLVLIGSGALVLVVLSVVVTVYLVNRPPATAIVPAATPVPSVAAAAIKTPAPTAAVETAAPPIIVPTITPPASSIPAPAEPAAATAALAVAPVPITPTPTTPVAITPPGAPAASITQPLVAVHSPPPAPPPAAATPGISSSGVSEPAPNLAPDAPDERVTAFVESVRVTGIRSSGAESRVLMNERVYRVNDIVERTLNVRLIKAAADSLTFRDARGVTYEKRF